MSERIIDGLLTERERNILSTCYATFTTWDAVVRGLRSITEHRLLFYCYRGEVYVGPGNADDIRVWDGVVGWLLTED